MKVKQSQLDILEYDNSDNSEEIITIYTNEEKEIIEYLKKLIKNTYDPDCPLIIYKSSENIKSSPIFSFSLNQVLSKPKWFSIDFKKNKYILELVLSDKEIEDNENIKKALSGYQLSRNSTTGWLRIECNPNQEALMEMLREISEVLIHRFEFLYDHRLVEQCCCDLQKICTESKKCVCVYREMAMKCSYRRLKERNGEFIISQ